MNGLVQARQTAYNGAIAVLRLVPWTRVAATRRYILDSGVSVGMPVAVREFDGSEERGFYRALHDGYISVEYVSPRTRDARVVLHRLDMIKTFRVEKDADSKPNVVHVPVFDIED